MTRRSLLFALLPFAWLGRLRPTTVVRGWDKAAPSADFSAVVVLRMKSRGGTVAEAVEFVEIVNVA